MPVFILYSERSGSNLLRFEITKNQKTYFGPSPAHLLKNIGINALKYGDLDEDENFKRLINDAISLTKIHFSPWELEFDVETLFTKFKQNYQTRSVVKLMDLMYKEYANFKGFKDYINKENNVFNHIHDIQSSNINNAKYIYLYRDPRDVVASQLKRPTSHRSSKLFAERWVKEQNEIKNALSLVEVKDTFRLSYKDFLDNRDQKLKEILDFTGAEVGQHIGIEEIDIGTSHEWKNLSKKVIKGNTKKYLQVLSENQLKIVEMICWDLMEELHFIPENKSKPNVSNWARKKDQTIGSLVGKWNKLKARFSPKLKIKHERAVLLNKLHKSKVL